MSNKARELDFISYVEARRKNVKYPTDYLAQFFIWLNKTTIINSIWLFMKIVKQLIKWIIWGQEFRSGR
tara:strand:- start:655 stop:861 length:207 start_codon:yes stop_codon:yes gene_type:complete